LFFNNKLIRHIIIPKIKDGSQRIKQNSEILMVNFEKSPLEVNIPSPNKNMSGEIKINESPIKKTYR